ncbi:unnamed protein product [Closterium sp. NIES-65]|nr:unnamed protein product [Closterium sp. NIES-65]
MAIPSELNIMSQLLASPQQETYSRQFSEHSAPSRQLSENGSLSENQSASREACEQELVRRRGLEAMVAQVVGSDGHSWLKYGQKQVKGSTATRCARVKSNPRCPAKKTVDITCSNRNEPPSPDAFQVTYRCTLHNHPLPPRQPLLPIRRPPTRHIFPRNHPTKCFNKRPAYRSSDHPNHPNKRVAFSPADLPTGHATDEHFNLADSHRLTPDSHPGDGDTPFNADRPAEFSGGLNALASESDFGGAVNAPAVDSGEALSIVARALQNGSVEVSPAHAASAADAAAADAAVEFEDWAAEALLHSPCQQERLIESTSLRVWDLPPLSPLPTLLRSSPLWLDEVIPVSACSTDLSAAAVDPARSTVSLERLLVALGCQTLEEDHSRRFTDQDSEYPTDEIDSLLGATSPTKQGLQELSSLRCSATNHAGQAGLLREYLGRRGIEEEQTAPGVGRNGKNSFPDFRCQGEEGSVHGPTGATPGALLGCVLPHAAALGAAVSDAPGSQPHQDVPVPPLTATALHTLVRGQNRPSYAMNAPLPRMPFDSTRKSPSGRASQPLTGTTFDALVNGQNCQASANDALLPAPRATAQADAQACDQAWSSGFSAACGTSYHSCSTDFNTSSPGYLSQHTSCTGSDMNRSQWHSPPQHAEATEGVEEAGLVQQQCQQQQQQQQQQHWQQQQDPPGMGTFGSRNSRVPSMRNAPPPQLAAFPTAPKHGMSRPQKPLVPSMHQVPPVRLAAFLAAGEREVSGPLATGSAQHLQGHPNANRDDEVTTLVTIPMQTEN